MPQTLLIPENNPYYVMGHGENQDHVCLMLHALGGDCYELSPLATSLQQAGYSVLGVRYQGHGEEQTHLPHSNWHEWADHVLNEYQRVAASHAKVSLVGFSTGGPLAVYLSQHIPTHSLVLLAPFFGFRHFKPYGLRPETWLALANPWVSYLPAGRLPISCPLEQKKAQTFRQYRWFSVPIIHSALNLIDTIQPVLSQVVVPVLAVYSPRDAVVCRMAIDNTLAQMSRAATQRHELVTSNHIVCRDVEADSVNTAGLNFLQSMAPPFLH